MPRFPPKSLSDMPRPSFSDIFTIHLLICAVIYDYMLKEGSKNITLKVNSKTYDTYRALCKKKGWVVSRQFEIFMEEELKKRGEKYE